MAETVEDKEALYQLSQEYVATLANFLSGEDTEKAILLFQDNCDKFINGDICFFLNAMKNFVTYETFKDKPKVFDCVREILIHLAETAYPNWAIIDLVEFGETAYDHMVLLVVLDPLKITLNRMQPKWSYSLMWCLILIEKRLIKLTAPVSHFLRGRERISMGCDPDVARIVHIYRCIEPFYSHFVSKLSAATDAESMKEKRFLTRSIIIILGYPLVYNALKRGDQIKNESRIIAENLVINLSCISNDLLKYLAYTDEINKPKLERKIPPKKTDDAYDVSAEEETEGLFDADSEIPVLGLGVLYYLIIGEKEFEELLPCVYSPLYIFQKGLCLSSELLKTAELELVYKGLVLAEAVIGKVSEASVSNSQIETETHDKFLDRLQPVMIFCPVEGHRRFAIRVLNKYLSVLDRKCQYLLFVHLFNTVRDLGTVAFLITYIKDVVSAEMKHGMPVSPYFKGRLLRMLMKMSYKLPEAEQTDLVKHVAPINAMLNFIRFMILRDKCDETGFRSCLPELRREFLVPLENAIKLSKHNFTLQLELETEKKPRELKRETEDKTEISVSVSGNTLLADKVGSIQSSLTHFDLMESLLCRVNECLDSVQI